MPQSGGRAMIVESEAQGSDALASASKVPQLLLARENDLINLNTLSPPTRSQYGSTRVNDR